MTSFDRLFRGMTKPWVVISYVLLVTLSFLYLDKPLTLFCQSLDWGTYVVILKGLTFLGCKTIYVLGLPIIALVLRYVLKNIKWASRTWFLWLCVFIPNAVLVAFKILFGRARPELFLQANEYGFKWMQFDHLHHSFPSGHTTTIMGIVFGLWILIPRYRFAYLLVGVLVACSRVLLLQHYLSDVLTATYFTLIEVWIIQYMLQRYAPKWMKGMEQL